MNLKIGIVGLPNVGKSTLFNALTKSKKAAAENFPFCTIDPNVGIVEVPDQRIEKLAELVKPEKVVRSAVEFVDIAGLVKGASEGEGLGNQFLSHIRECQAVCHVLRDFEDPQVHHVDAEVDPRKDLDTILTELTLADLQSVEKQLERVEKKAKSGDKEAKMELGLLERVKTVLGAGNLASSIELNDEEAAIFRTFHLLTAKPYMIVANVGEDHFSTFDEAVFRSKVGHDAIPIVPICAKFEAELADMSLGEAREFLADIGAERSGLEQLIQTAFRLLRLESYFTAGPKEVRSWTIRQGSSAPQAAGEIHTDFQKGFIKAEVISYNDFVTCGGEQEAKDQGKLRTEGKDYVVADGDVMHFRFNN